MRTVIITGATSGIGFAVARALAKLGYHVIGVGRTIENCEAARDKLLSEIPGARIDFFYGDMMQQREVHRLADDLSAHLDRFCGGRLQALINNAGCVRSWYTTSEEGYEQQFSLNHLSGFLLTYRLFPYLKRCNGRMLLTSSSSHKMMKMNWKDIMFKNRYYPLMAYKQSKLCNMLFAYAFNTRFAKEGVRAYAVDPGLVNTEIGNKQTGGLVNFVWRLRKAHGVSADTPAQTYVYLCEQQPGADGLYYYHCRKQKYGWQVNEANAERLFKMSEQLCSIEYEVNAI